MMRNFLILLNVSNVPSNRGHIIYQYCATRSRSRRNRRRCRFSGEQRDEHFYDRFPVISQGPYKRNRT